MARQPFGVGVALPAVQWAVPQIEGDQVGAPFRQLLGGFRRSTRPGPASDVVPSRWVYFFLLAPMRASSPARLIWLVRMCTQWGQPHSSSSRPGAVRRRRQRRRAGGKPAGHRRLCAVSWSAPLTREHDGDTYLVKRIGRTDGPQIALVHGIGAASRYFRRPAAVLARSAGVHVRELPGSGGAPKPAAPLSVEQLAAVVNDYGRSADLSRPVLVGHSMGSQIVLEASLQEPGAASTVVAIGTVVDPSARTA